MAMRHLAVVPLNTRHQWITEINKLCPGLGRLVKVLEHREIPSIKEPDIMLFVMSHDSFRDLTDGEDFDTI